MITSATNKKIKDVVALNKRSLLRKNAELFTIEGTKMFEELESKLIEQVFVSETYYDKCSANFKNKLASLRCEMVSDQVFSALSDTKTPQGILAVAKQLQYNIDDILNISGKANLLILETIQDPGNLGTMIRAGEGAGITGIIMDMTTVDIYNPKVTRSTMGSLFRVPFIYVDDLKQTIKSIKSKGIKTYAAHLDGQADYDKCDYSQDTAFMIGNEAKGLTEETSKLADTLIKIPMLGKVESLNAAIASSILMYELARQRRS